MDNALLNQERLSKEILQSQIFYSPQPRKSTSTQNGSIVNVGKLKNVTQSAISTANATQDINYRDRYGDKNPTMQMSITERVVTEAILDLNIALRQHSSSIRQQSSLVNNNSSFISMNENEKILLRKNRVQYQADGLLIQKHQNNEEFFIPILPIKSKFYPYMLEIKEVYDGKKFYEEQEVFLTFDHLTNFYFNLKIYIVEKGSDDAILFAMDNANFVFDVGEDIPKNVKNHQIKAFCLENIEKNQLNLFFLQKTQAFFDSDSNSSSSSSENEGQEEENDVELQKQDSSNKKSQRNDSKNRSTSGKKNRIHNMSYSRRQEEKLQRIVKKYIKIARAYSFLGQPEMAINYYNRIFNNQNINKFNVSEVDALEELMFFLEEMDKETEAIKKADRLLEIFGKIGNMDKMKQILFFKGNLSIKIGDFKQAEKDYCKLLEYLNLEDGDEMSYFSGITYGKLADIQFILSNNEKCLELLNDKYNTLIELYRSQDLPEIQELNDDEEEYQQFNRNNYETVQYDQDQNNSTHIQNTSENGQAEQNKDCDSKVERYKILERKFLEEKEREKNNQLIEDYDFEYLGDDNKKVTFTTSQSKKSKDDQEEELEEEQIGSIYESENEEENNSEQQKSEGSDFQSEDIRQMAKDNYKGLRKNLFNAQVEQSPMLRNSSSSPQKKKFEQIPNYNSCQQSMLKSEILRFDQKIVKELWNCSMQIADIYFQIEDIQFSLSYYTKSIEFAEKLFGKESLQVAQLQESIGLVRLENMDFDESLEAFQKSMLIKQKVCCDDHPQLAFCYSYLGCLYAKFHMYKQAKEQYLKALTIFQFRYKENKKELSETYNNIANIYLNEAEIELAISSYEKALELFIQLQQEIPQLHFAQIYENLGIAYFQLGQFDKSLPYFEESEIFLLNLYDENHPSLARVRNWKKSNIDKIDLKGQIIYTS